MSHIINVWSGECYSNTLMVDDVLLIKETSEQVFYAFCQKSLDQAYAWKDSHWRVGIYDADNRLRYLGFYWKGDKHQTSGASSMSVEDWHDFLTASISDDVNEIFADLVINHFEFGHIEIRG